MFNYTNGNEWLKWDLHLHDPNTIFNNQYKGRNREEVWEKFISSIEKSNIDVLGITNYYSISGFKKIMEYKRKGRLKNVKAIFPNVEVRLTTGAKGNRFINYHIIFDPKIADDIETLFLNKLTFRCGKDNFNLNQKEIVKLGKLFVYDEEEKNNYNEERLYKKGLEVFKADIDQINEILEDSKEFKGKYFRVVSGSSVDGVSSLITDSQGSAVRDNIFLKTDAMFATNKRTIDLFKGNGNCQEREYLYKNYGGPRPCFEGSDAHGFNGEFNKKWTWIKAEPTFNGLLQTKFEPERRVKESKYFLKSPLTKSGNEWIKSIRLNNSKEKVFQENINFNPGLNAIIGGKSSGKSILLYEITKAAGQSNFEKIKKADDYKFTDYDSLEIEPNITLGDQTELKDEIRVNYFPQLFINSISEEFTNKELQDIIKTSLEKNDKIYNNISKFDVLKNKTEESLALELKECTNLIASIDESKNKVSKIGKLSYLETNLKNKEEECHSLKSKLILTEEEKTKFENYQSESRRLEKSKQNCEQDKENCETNYKLLSELIKSIREVYLNSKINTDLRKRLESPYNDFEKALNSELGKIQGGIVKKERSIKVYKDKLDNLSKDIKPIMDKQDRSKEINQCEDEVKSIEENISVIKKEEKNTKKYKDEMKNRLSLIEDKVISFEEKSRKIVENLTGVEITNGLKLKTELMFDQKLYETEIIDKFDGRSLSNAKIDGLLEKPEVEAFSEYWIDLIKNTVNNKFGSELKKNSDYIDLLQSLSNLPIDMPINLKKDNDDLSMMSPGKRAIVVLELLLEGDPEDKSPILIDQPEDNLDNRTISEELVGLLRKVSLYRQVFVVTHNANLVVLADADEVIVANQDPEIEENEKFKFEYITGSLENSTGFDDDSRKLASKGIRNDITDILEGGVEAFRTREKKYLLN